MFRTMRQIKFRAQDIASNKWLYGDLRHHKDDVCIFEQGGTKGEQVKRDTVGQFTGLRDINGKEIYEGDIICVEGEPFGYIKWNPKGYFYIHQSTVFDYQDCVEVGVMAERYHLKVDSNIYDNPELFTNQKNTKTCKSCKRRYDDAHLSFPDCWDGHKEENKRRGTGCKYYVFDENIL